MTASPRGNRSSIRTDAAVADADGGDSAGRYVVEVEVDHAAVAVDRALVELVDAAVRRILVRESVVPATTSVNVLLTGDDRLRTLNRQFAGDDYVTDVLAFPTDAGEPFPGVMATGDALATENGVDEDGNRDAVGCSPELTDPPAEPTARDARRELGDIAISMPQVERQAREHGVSVARELALLAIHGTLHLLGYDHATAEEERDMFGRTDAALAELFGEVSG